MKTKVFVLSLCIAGVLMACNRGEEKSNPEVQDTKTSVQFVGVADDGSFDKLIISNPNPEAFREMNEDLGIDLKDVKPNTVEVFTYSPEYYNKHYSITMNLRSLGRSSYFALVPNSENPTTMDVVRAPKASELGKEVENILNLQTSMNETTDKLKFSEWVTEQTAHGYVVLATYSQETGVYGGKTLPVAEWEATFGKVKEALNIKYYECLETIV